MSPSSRSSIWSQISSMDRVRVRTFPSRAKTRTPNRAHSSQGNMPTPPFLPLLQILSLEPTHAQAGGEDHQPRGHPGVDPQFLGHLHRLGEDL